MPRKEEVIDTWPCASTVTAPRRIELYYCRPRIYKIWLKDLHCSTLMKATYGISFTPYPTPGGRSCDVSGRKDDHGGVGIEKGETTLPD